MSLYPPSNWVESTVPVEAGGCGQPHRRPYVNGKPVHPYALECPPCEDYLRKAMPDQWSATLSKIPETYDEKLIREDFDRRGAMDKDAILTLALARLAGIPSAELPDSLTRMISGVPAHIPVAGQMVCPAGHDNPAGMKFCGQCGASMSGQAAIGGPQHAAAPPVAASSPLHGARPVRLQDLRHDELQAACRARGLPDQGVRKDLMKRLRGAGVTNADLQSLLVAA